MDTERECQISGVQNQRRIRDSDDFRNKGYGRFYEVYQAILTKALFINPQFI